MSPKEALSAPFYVQLYFSLFQIRCRNILISKSKNYFFGKFPLCEFEKI